jgi:ATP adenylyltransferase
VTILLEPGSLWSAIVRQTARARASGDLQPVATELHELEDRGARFAVRVIAGLDPKRVAATSANPTQSDPFLPPYRDELFVADISETHAALLNKWSVLDHHLLIVTRAFEEQESALGASDFEALWACMAEFEALGFYNAGQQAGASQPHKHLQLVPLPLGTDRPPAARTRLPIESLLDTGLLPFAYARASLPDRSRGLGADPGDQLELLYRQLIEELSLDGGCGPRGPYNLLLTRDWMLIVPRTCDAWDGIAINALGFAGALLVGDRQALEKLSRCGPLRGLSRVARPPRASGGSS